MRRISHPASSHHHTHRLARLAFAGVVHTGDGELDHRSDRQALEGLLLAGGVQQLQGLGIHTDGKSGGGGGA